MKFIPAGLLMLVLAGCAAKAVSIGEGRAAERLPTSEEVMAYVHAHWSSDYAKRYSSFASRPGDSAELVEVTNVACDYYIVTPECSFDVAARFPNERSQLRQMFDQFGWTGDGQLQSILVMYHMRRP